MHVTGQIKSILRDFVVRLLPIAVLLSTSLTAYAEIVRPEDSESIQIGLEPDRKNPVLKVDIQKYELNGDSVAELTRLIESKSTLDKSMVVLSTDNPKVAEAAAKKIDKDRNRLAIVSIDTNEKSLRKSGKFLELVKNFAKSGYESAKSDKIGVMILTYTTASESFIWIHSTNLSQFERTSNVVYSVALAVVFGLNKDAWAITTRPIQNFFRQIIKPQTLLRTDPKELAVRFLGNFTLGALVTSVRVPLMSMDQIIEQGIRFEYFSMPLLLTVVTTSALFTWSEHLALINEKTHPVAKFVFRRANEIRSLIIGTFATSAALLTPSQYGSSPWITMASIGVAGALIYFNGEAITSWLESRPWLKLKSKPQLPVNLVRPILCDALFG